MSPSRNTIPYGRQQLDDEDIAAVVDTLRSDWLTTGPKIPEFEKNVAEFVGTSEAVAVCSGTAALHCAIYAAGIGKSDEVIVTPMTFASSANCIVFQGATPVFADVDDHTLLIDPEQVEAAITPRTKAILAVDYAGQPCNYDELQAIANRHGLLIIADACHSLGAQYKGRNVGTLADLTAFSFHPVKHITTGEGGMVVTANERYAERMRNFRNHGITTDHHQRTEQGTWSYAMVDLGYNYRITDFQCALGISQLKKLGHWLERRREIAGRYDLAFAHPPSIRPLGVRDDVCHAYHLYVIRLNLEKIGASRDDVIRDLRARGIAANVHYIPVHMHPYYAARFGCEPGLCPIAEKAYEEIISLPMFPTMTDGQIEEVIGAVRETVEARV